MEMSSTAHGLCLRVAAAILVLVLCSGCPEETRGLLPAERAEMEAIFAEARKLDELGRYHEALVRYETILARHPEFMSTRINAAMAAYDSGQYQKANDHFEVLHKYGPNDWFIMRKLIQCNERLGNADAVETYRKELEHLRQQKNGSALLKEYEGLTRDYLPVGTMHLIGYEFFEPKKHGRLWFFKLEDKHGTTVSAFVLQATPFHENNGKRLFNLTEVSNGWMRIWHVGTEGRDYEWTREMVLACLQGKRQPLVTRPLPASFEQISAPSAAPTVGAGSGGRDERVPMSGAGAGAENALPVSPGAPVEASNGAPSVRQAGQEAVNKKVGR